jgi:ferredoxin
MAEAGDRVEAGVQPPDEVEAGVRPPDAVHTELSPPAEHEVDRREFLEQALKAGLGVPILLGVIRIQDLVAGDAGQEGYEPGEHYYGMGVDVGRCIGCGMCAQACKTENDVPLEPYYFNTWVERYVIQTDGEVVVDSPNGGMEGFPDAQSEGQIQRTFFVPKLCNHCEDPPCVQGRDPEDVLRSQAVQPLRRSALRAGLSRGRDVHHRGRRRPGGRRVLHRMSLLHPGLPLRRALVPPGEACGGQVHLLLPPTRRGPRAGVRRGVSNRRQGVR